jgi:hypothetical protein
MNHYTLLLLLLLAALFTAADGEPQLVVQKTVHATHDSVLAVGVATTVDILVVNTGSSTAYDVVATDAWPKKRFTVAATSATTPAAKKNNAAASSHTWAALKAGEQVTVSSARIVCFEDCPSDVLHTNTLTNNVYISSMYLKDASVSMIVLLVRSPFRTFSHSHPFCLHWIAVLVRRDAEENGLPGRLSRRSVVQGVNESSEE